MLENSKKNISYCLKFTKEIIHLMICTMYILEKLQMSIQTNKIIHINNEHIFGATTLKDITLPERTIPHSMYVSIQKLL